MLLATFLLESHSIIQPPSLWLDDVKLNNSHNNQSWMIKCLSVL